MRVTGRHATRNNIITLFVDNWTYGESDYKQITNCYEGWKDIGTGYSRGVGISAEFNTNWYDSGYMIGGENTCHLLNHDDTDLTSTVSCIPVIALGTDFDASSIKINN